jgi:hypothetical protein
MLTFACIKTPNHAATAVTNASLNVYASVTTRTNSGINTPSIRVLGGYSTPVSDSASSLDCWYLVDFLFPTRADHVRTWTDLGRPGQIKVCD